MINYGSGRVIESKCKMFGKTNGKEILNVSECADTYLDYMLIRS